MRHNLLETLISIPYNIVVAGHKQLGLDAYFWDKLRVLYRRVLLIRNTEALSIEPLGCRLPIEVNSVKQFEDLRNLSEEDMGRDKSINIPLSLIRIASLLIPYTIAEKFQDPIVKRLIEADEKAVAVKIAKTILSWGDIKPTGTVMWLNIRIQDYSIQDNLLNTLNHIDEEFHNALIKALRACR